jgi:hypothetical protein
MLNGVFHTLKRDSKGRPQRGADMNGERLPSPDKEAKAGMIIIQSPTIPHTVKLQHWLPDLQPLEPRQAIPVGSFHWNERRLAELSESTVRLGSPQNQSINQN